MKTYPVVEITFSPTGGTKKVADLISCYLGNITNTVNLIRHDVSFSDVAVPSDSLAVIAAPVFEGVIPDIAIERMKEIQGNHANCVVIAVYGNRAYDVEPSRFASRQPRVTPTMYSAPNTGSRQNASATRTCTAP